VFKQETRNDRLTKTNEWQNEGMAEGREETDREKNEEEPPETGMGRKQD